MRIKFVAVGEKNSIKEQDKYVKYILEKMYRKGLVDNYVVDAIDEYPTASWCKIEKDNKLYDIVFEFETYKKTKLLSVEIIADEIEPEVEDVYFESIKFFIKDAIRRDWEKIVWIYDDDASVLSNDLYNRFFLTENLIRCFINEFMIKTFGPEWWEQITDQSIKDKYKARYKGYKTIVPGFCNVDDHLFSIDVGDLLKLLTLQKMKWNPEHNNEIENALLGNTIGNENKIIEKLKNQLTVEVDFWEQYFKKFFDDDFKRVFEEFEANRNHVAHNKFLDRQAYNSIYRSIEKMNLYMEKALNKLYEYRKSQEQLNAETQTYEERLLSTKQDDTGVTIRNTESIIKLFEDIIIYRYSDITDALRFREDIEFTEMKFDPNKSSGKLFSAISKVTNQRLDFYYYMEVDDEEGAESKLFISCEKDPFEIDESDEEKGFCVSISYTNGAVSYDDEQGYYMPITEDGISESDIDNYIDNIVQYINTKLTSRKDYVESIRYETIKEGGNLPIAAGIYCDECGEEYICTDESLAEVGTCLNCGAHNDIAVCERCGQYFIDHDKDEIKLCDSCKEHYEKE